MHNYKVMIWEGKYEECSNLELWSWRPYNRVICKVRKTQHQNPEFGHTQGEIRKKPANKYISIQRGMKLRKPSILVVNWVSSCLSLSLSASTAATYIFTAPKCTTTVISLEHRTLNAEFQHFILSCSILCWDLIKMSLLCGYRWERESIGGERRPKDRVKTGLLYR
jgi:hypothetical protein